MNSIGDVVFLLVFVAMLSIGLRKIGGGGLALFIGLRRQHSEPAPARVLESGTRCTRLLNKFWFEPRITYTYQVDGVTFTSRRYSPGIEYLEREDAQRVADAHPPGTEIVVYYDRQFPRLSWIVPGRIGTSMELIIEGMLLAGLGGLSVTAYLR